MPAVRLKCTGCDKNLNTYLNVIADVFGKYTKVLIHKRDARGYGDAVRDTGEHPDYYCIKCWESAK